MTEETTTEEAQEEVQEETTEPTPELTDEQIATALGVDVEYLKEVKPEIQNLKGFYAKVNKRNQDLVEKQRELEEKGSKPKDDSEEDIDLDPQAQKVLRKFIQKEFGPLLQSIEQERSDTSASILDEFVSDHRDVPPEKLYEALDELDLWKTATTPSKVKKALNSAYKYAKNNLIDPDAEIERRVAERLKELKGDDEEIVEVKSNRAKATSTRTVGSVIDDPNLSWPEMMRLLQED